MKEAVGTTMVLNFVLIFIGIFIALYIGSIAYSKGFKVRNRIIDIIEKYDGYTSAAQTEIDENLRMVGYQIDLNQNCEAVDNPEDSQNPIQPLNTNSSYNYCVYEFHTSKGYYYGVRVFIHFDFPIIGSFIEIPLYGESRILFEKSEVEG